MEFNEKERQEIRTFLSVFGIIPEFKNNKITKFSSQEGIYLEDTDEYNNEYINKSRYSTYLLENILEKESFNIWKIEISKKSQLSIIINEEYKYTSEINYHNEKIEGEIRHIILYEDFKQSNEDSSTAKFIIYSEGEILFKVFINNMQYAIGTTEGTIVRTKLYDNVEEFKEHLKEEVLKYDKIEEYKLEIIIKFIKMQIENIYNDIKNNPQKYQERLDICERKVKEKYQSDLSALTGTRENAIRRLTRQRKAIKRTSEQNN